jgi:hypothetical protein
MRLILLLLAAGAVAPEGERETVAETALAEGLAAMAPAEREMFWAKLRRRVARPPSLVAPAEEVGGRRRRVQAGNYSVGSCLGYPTPPSMQRNADTGVRPVHPPALSLSRARFLPLPLPLAAAVWHTQSTFLCVSFASSSVCLRCCIASPTSAAPGSCGPVTAQPSETEGCWWGQTLDLVVEVDDGSDLNILASHVAKVLLEEVIGFKVSLISRPDADRAMERLAKDRRLPNAVDVNMGVMAEAKANVAAYFFRARRIFLSCQSSCQSSQASSWWEQVQQIRGSRKPAHRSRADWVQRPVWVVHAGPRESLLLSSYAADI